MVLYNNKNVKINTTKCKKPKFKNDHRGRTWDAGTIKIDGVKYDAHLDTTWGEYIYFQYGPEYQWFKCTMHADPNIIYGSPEDYDIDPFLINPEELFTKKGN
jgi:hypothetical protein